jgi:hypothetical protein
MGDLNHVLGVGDVARLVGKHRKTVWSWLVALEKKHAHEQPPPIWRVGRKRALKTTLAGLQRYLPLVDVQPARDVEALRAEVLELDQLTKRQATELSTLRREVAALTALVRRGRAA